MYRVLPVYSTIVNRFLFGLVRRVIPPSLADVVSVGVSLIAPIVLLRMASVGVVVGLSLLILGLLVWRVLAIFFLISDCRSDSAERSL